MPELPEVETVARQLAPLLSGRRVTQLHVLDAKLALRNAERVVRGRLIAGVERVGKQIVLTLRDTAAPRASLWLAVHLRMTGRLIRLPGPPAPAKNLRAWLALDQGSLAFHDTRRFGMMTLHDDPAALQPKGLDPLARAFTPAALTRLLADGRQPIKPWLLRQDRLVGLGNIYASEILFAAGIDPNRPVASLRPGEIADLHRHTRRILRSAIRHCGTTFSDFQDSSGSIGNFQRYLKVYGREGLPCPRCGALVLRTTQQQRSTFHCPACQA